MANRYWVGGTGNWSDATNHWSDSSGGTPNASFLPTTSDDVFFDGNSGTGTCTITSSSYCKNLTYSSTTVTLASNSTSRVLYIYGNLNISSGVTISMAGRMFLFASSGNFTIDTNGISLTSLDYFRIGNYGTTATYQLSSELVVSSFYHYYGTFDPNSQTVTIHEHPINHDSSFSIPNSGTTFYNLTISTLTDTYHEVDCGENNVTVTNNLTISGYSVSSRIKMYAGTYTYNRFPVSAENTSLSNADFQGFTASGNGDWSGTSLGDLGGNTGITFSPVTRYWVGDGGNFNDTSQWSDESGGDSGSSVPISGDTIVFDGNSISSGSQTIVFNNLANTIIKGLDFSNVTNTPTLSLSENIGVFDSVNLTGLGGFTHNSKAINFYGTANATFTSNSFEIYKIYIGYYDGTLTLNDNLEVLFLEAYLSAKAGLNTGNYDIDCYRLDFFCDGTLTLGSSTITCDSVAGISFRVGSYSTVICGTSEIIINGLGTSNKDFYGGGKTYYNVTIQADNVDIQGNNTFNTLTLDNAGGTYGTIFQSESYKQGTQTITNFVANGSVGSLVKIRSSSTTNATLNYTGTGVVDVDYVDIDYITGTPDNTWYVGTNSTDGGHNSQIYFIDVPPVVTNSDTIIITDVPTVSISALEINESETIDVTDATPIINAPLPDLDINKSETITVTELVTLIQSDLQINKSELVLVGETLNNMTDWTSDLSVSKSDSLTITDLPIVSVQEVVALEIDESDEVTVTDTPNVENQLSGVESYETITVTDSPTVYIFQENLEIDTNEFIYTLENIDFIVPVNLTADDTIVVTDNVETENVYSIESVQLITVTTNPLFRFGKGRKRVISNVGKNSPTFKVNPNKPRMNVRRYKR